MAAANLLAARPQEVSSLATKLGFELRGERTSRQKASGYDEEEGCVFHGHILIQHEATH
jgi:hypothetical protein